MQHRIVDQLSAVFNSLLTRWKLVKFKDLVDQSQAAYGIVLFALRLQGCQGLHDADDIKVKVFVVKNCAVIFQGSFYLNLIISFGNVTRVLDCKLEFGLVKNDKRGQC